ncbi:glycine--tRNA ligase subunit beta [Magnetovibrio blakemorei]|uniref:Glycine--tRNA ligase beta subunit n=1 Tax=Magnetovibrio blakemorei TaxID=28181 RepID=A0A1E5Q5M8_9PROT|nr:glycine--tRNA ligase subunit beta [Magnetovibrio blakemorei]OEJ65701.1 glycine--tRNA ligase subunit beta [Magnetovibrio blakemorei]
MAELLLELFSEEIPARMQATAAADLKRLVEDGLKKAGLDWTKSEAFVTPRRLALVIDGLPEKQPDVKDERKGPQVGAPEQALAGFVKSLGDMSLDDCEQRDVKGKMFYFAVIEKKGEPTLQVLPGLLDAAINALPWPKSMRWGAGTKRWVRPLHNILALFGGSVVPVTFEHCTANQHTFGHRFLNPGPIAVTNFADYRAKLMDAHVMLCPSERRAEIVSQAEKLAENAGLTLRPDEGLLQEVTGLIEWPVVLMGSIDAEFMEVPPEVLTTTMRINQKYFTVLNADGTLAPNFIVVANQMATDGGEAIVAGNERVLRARLSDAKFFWDQDRKTSLASRTPALKDIVFHAKLGTVDEKIDRVQALSADLCAYIPGADRDHVRSAARLAKADLVTGMVGEFPELQGVMGRYYALADGESLDVANAIAEHYSPVGPGDACPTAPVSVAVAMADKLDTLAGFWTIDEKPTGSKDPFALRRAALGVIRLIVENKLRIPLTDLFYKQHCLHVSNETGRRYIEKKKLLDDPDIRGGEVFAGAVGDTALPYDLLAFFADRLKVHLKGEGVRHDLIDAVFSLGGEDDLVRLLARVDALSAFVATDDGANLLAAHKRATNILRIEEKKDGASYQGTPNESAFVEDAERTLFQALKAAGATSKALVADEKFSDAMSALAQLRGPLDVFFEAVLVNADDKTVRENRLKLLSQIQSVMGEIADFSKIEG